MSKFKIKPFAKLNKKLDFISKNFGITREIFAVDFFKISRVALSYKSNGHTPWTLKEMYKFIDIINGIVRENYPEEVIEYNELHLYFPK